MAAPVITQNELNPDTLEPGQDAEWRTVASDPDSGSTTLRRSVTDASGNATVVEATLTMSDPLTYGVPTCDDPRVTLTVDTDDPTMVHVHLAE